MAPTLLTFTFLFLVTGRRGKVKSHLSFHLKTNTLSDFHILLSSSVSAREYFYYPSVQTKGNRVFETEYIVALPV